jgi:hypothetical protein
MMQKSAHVIGALIVLAFLVASFAQGPPRLTLRIDFPNGESREIPPIPDGDVVGIQFLHESGHYSFGLRLRISDHANELVRVTITTGPQGDGSVLDEVNLTAGGSAVHTDTSPSFGLAILRIDH